MSQATQASVTTDLIHKAISKGTQEWILTLPHWLIDAFKTKHHKKFIDPTTKRPFASFYHYFMGRYPPGCGLGDSEACDPGPHPWNP